MTELVFLEPNKIDAVPFTTSEVIAEFAGVTRHAVQTLIQNYESDFAEFGRVSFEMQPLPTNGGIQNVKVYRLNEEQATLLMTYLKNTEQVRAFKKELVRQFYAMRRELLERRVARAKLTPARRELTDVIRDCVPDSPHKAMKYKLYTDLAYKVALGKNASQIRKVRNAPKKAVAADYLTSEELNAVEQITKQIGVLLEIGMDYQTIKTVILGATGMAVKNSAQKERPQTVNSQQTHERESA